LEIFDIQNSNKEEEGEDGERVMGALKVIGIISRSVMIKRKFS